MLLHDSLTKIFQTQECPPALLMIAGFNNNARILKFKKIDRQMQSAQTDGINPQKKRYNFEMKAPDRNHMRTGHLFIRK